ncbi:MAG: DUF4124 domain-containing protein [Gammaproteobacteria bacterium]|nr:DUF4124 domain-containing protein [Gammaproteobacteria bacterium]
MKMSIFGMLFILILLTVGPLIYFNGGEQYIKEWLFSSPGNTTTPELNTEVTYAPVTTDEKITVYKWKDKNGVWQFGNAPPPGLAGVESMTLQPDVNIMKSIPVSAAEKTQEGHSGVVSIRGGKPVESSGNDQRDNDGVGISQESLDNPYAPDSIKELFNSSKNIQQMLDNRQQQQLNSQPK